MRSTGLIMTALGGFFVVWGFLGFLMGGASKRSHTAFTREWGRGYASAARVEIMVGCLILLIGVIILLLSILVPT